MASENLEIEELILLHLKDEINEEQRATLTTWRAQSEHNEKLFIKLTDGESLHRLLTSFQDIATSNKLQQKAINVSRLKSLG
jgi:hypothetical protein